jgi:hypothetical protein
MTHKAAWILALCCALPALAQAQQGPNDVEMLKKYAGTWAVDCSKPAGARLIVDARTLMLKSGGKQLQTSAPLAAFSYFGKQQPPAGFDVALLGEGQPTGLTLMAMKDASGPYLTVDADTPLHKQFGRSALAGKFRRCP